MKIAVICDPSELKVGRELAAALEGQGLDVALVEPRVFASRRSLHRLK